MFERPWRTGKFNISAGLRPLTVQPVFLLETNLEFYLSNKRSTREENPYKYYPKVYGLTLEEMDLIAEKLRKLLASDLPDYHLDQNFPARDPVDFIISQIPEDFAVWKMKQGKDWMALIHLSSPNHWSAGEKIGRGFKETHDPVPHIMPLSKASPKLFDQAITKGPVERYAWGLATDSRLNHHPDPPAGISEESWRGRSFDPKIPELFIRLERQTLFPIGTELLGFTIKTSFIDVQTLPPEDLIPLGKAIAAMDSEVLKYKGLHKTQNTIVQWLKTLLSA